MPIGRANGSVTAKDINLEIGSATTGAQYLGKATQQLSLNDFSLNGSIFSDGASNPGTDQDGNGFDDAMSSLDGYSRGSKIVSALDGYMQGPQGLPAPMKVTYTSPFTFAFWYNNQYDSNPIANGYQPRMIYMGTASFGVRTFEFFYEGKLTNGTYSNKFIARLVRSAFGTGRRENRWDLGTNGFVTNGNGWNASNPGSGSSPEAFQPASRFGAWNHFVVVYDGAGQSAGQFNLYVNGALWSSKTSNHVNDSSNTWSYNDTEALAFGNFIPSNVQRNFAKWGQVCYFNSALNATQVSTLYNGGVGRGCNSITDNCAWWGNSGITSASYERATRYGIPSSFTTYDLSQFGTIGSASSRPAFPGEIVEGKG